MSDIYTALSLCLIAKRNFVIHTHHYQRTINDFKHLLHYSCRLPLDDFVVVDLLSLSQECEDKPEKFIHSLVEASIWCQNDATSTQDTKFRSIVVWRNLDKIDFKFHRAIVYDYLEPMEEYGTVASRLNPSEFINVAGFRVKSPSFSIIVPIIELGDTRAKVDQTLKNKFWFSQMYDSISSPPSPSLPSSQSYRDMILHLRTMDLASVYTSPDIKRYIYSLVIFTRTHRLCSLSPLTTRLPTSSIDSIGLLASTLVTWRQHQIQLHQENNEPTSSKRMFVTPEYCKVAYRKVAYWLVDWENNPLFKDLPFDDEVNDKDDDDADLDLKYSRQLEINTLTGDWYASEWPYVRQYLQKYKSSPDPASSVGFSNRMVEDVLTSVQPPL